MGYTGVSNICPPGVMMKILTKEELLMNLKELFKLIKYLAAIGAILAIVWMVVNSGFMLTSVKIETEKFNIEVLGNEKSTEPR